MELGELAQELKKVGNQKVSTFPATVKAVNVDAQTIDVEYLDGLELFDVRLKAIEDEQDYGFVIFPVLESEVTVTRFSGSDTESFVSAYSKVDYVLYTNETGFKVQLNKEDFTLITHENEYNLSFSESGLIITVGDMAVIMDADKISLKYKETSLLLEDGKTTFNEGKLGGLIKIEELKKECKKNSDAIQAIKDMFTNWVPAPMDGGAVLKGLSASLAAKSVGVFTNIEDKKIIH